FRKYNVPFVKPERAYDWQNLQKVCVIIATNMAMSKRIVTGMKTVPLSILRKQCTIALRTTNPMSCHYRYQMKITTARRNCIRKKDQSHPISWGNYVKRIAKRYPK